MINQCQTCGQQYGYHYSWCFAVASGHITVASGHVTAPSIKSPKYLEFGAELAALRKQNAQRLEEETFKIPELSLWNPKNYGPSPLYGIKTNGFNMVGYPVPMNRPKPVAHKCVGNSRKCKTATYRKRCVKCEPLQYDRYIRTSNWAYEWTVAVCRMANMQKLESGPGLATRYPDATPAAKPIQDVVLCVDDGRWED